MSDTLTPLERAVLERMLRGDDPILDALRLQFAGATVTERKMTGVGFFTTLKFPDDTPRAPLRGAIWAGDVYAEIPSLRHGAGFMIHIREGAVDLLEGYTYDEPWPNNVDGFVLSDGSGHGGLLEVLGRQK